MRGFMRAAKREGKIKGPARGQSQVFVCTLEGTAPSIEGRVPLNYAMRLWVRRTHVPIPLDYARARPSTTGPVSYFGH
jgi:hypothetical protein